jgi:hypothetical protein
MAEGEQGVCKDERAGSGFWTLSLHSIVAFVHILFIISEIQIISLCDMNIETREQELCPDSYSRMQLYLRNTCSHSSAVVCAIEKHDPRLHALASYFSLTITTLSHS